MKKVINRLDLDPIKS